MPTEFQVPIADLERGPKHLDAPLTLDWLSWALEGTEASARGPGQLSATLTKNGTEVLVQGQITAPLQMPCIRTLEPVDVDVKSDLWLLLEPRASEPRARPPQRGTTRLARTPSASAAKPPRRRAVEDPELSLERAARDTFSGDRVHLDDFIREFILLELPMAPLRSDLRSEAEQARPAPLAPQVGPGGAADPVELDPRLAPLAALASRLRQNKE